MATKKKAAAKKKAPAKKRMSKEEAEEELRARMERITDVQLERALAESEAVEKHVRESRGLKRFYNDVKTLFAMLRDYYRGRYREMPFMTIAAIIATILYLISPIDLIPDFIPIIGVIDDVAVLAVCVRWVRSDIKKYLAWRLREEK
ncbi:MAG: uncharacterized membrane protein YkvA (DUF1232 family) [Verrucomicrobiales bacterium]|jgi:uncharacterized membrane protein YkvA (DUF1232 family)